MTQEHKGYIIYVDSGGTFTDAFIVKPDGSFVSGKAESDPIDFVGSFFNAITAAAARMGSESVEEIIANCDEIGYGTTAGTNIIVTGEGGPKLGLITTRGIEDRTFVWRQRVAGLSQMEAMHMIATGYPKPLIPRSLVKGLTERIDCKGQVLLPLREEEARLAAEELLKEEVEGIAVCFLWSFLNSSHEERVRQIIEEIAPGIMVALSSEISPTVREYPRIMSTIIDLHIGKGLRELLAIIEERLNQYGYKRPLLVMQAAGGVAQSKVVNPGTTLHSGPVGGLMGVEFLKQKYGHKNAVGSDVGGTSFDICVSPEKGEILKRESVVGRYEVATPMREIITIGAGGGTIAWIDKITRTLHVGPQSAGAVPGPVCYGKGGTEPTVTDADLVLNRINPDYFLDGSMWLNRERSMEVIEEKIAKPLQLDVIKAAEGIVDIIDASMSAALKAIVSAKGITPDQYVLFAYGGMGATHCCGYAKAKGLGFSKIIVVPYSSVFCAFGGATSDIQHRYEASPLISWRDLPYNIVTQRFELEQLTSLDQFPALTIERYNTLVRQLEKRAYDDLLAEGFSEEEAILSHEVLARYAGQLYETRCSVPVGAINEVEDVQALLKAFEEEYLSLFSAEAMAPRGGVEIISIAVVASAPATKPGLTEHEFVGKDASHALKGEREVYFDGRWMPTKIYEMARLQAGNMVEGPAIIETVDTTLVVTPQWRLTVDNFLNMALESK
jgi:N-methylhydantoinase A/oxoprolinase/acetone carboxylase beta subunit